MGLGYEVNTIYQKNGIPLWDSPMERSHMRPPPFPSNYIFSFFVLITKKNPKN